VAVFRDL
ncbi:hypothetical protein D047_3383B, partial [Vibrio parahaemolyticus VPTS-2010_2]